MTKQENHGYDSSDRPAFDTDGIEITPAMLAVGARIVADRLDCTWASAEEFAAGLFIEMAKASQVFGLEDHLLRPLVDETQSDNS